MGWLARFFKRLFRTKGALRRGLQKVGGRIARRQNRVKQLKEFIERNGDNTTDAMRKRVQKAQEELAEQERKLADDLVEQQQQLDELGESPAPTSPAPDPNDPPAPHLNDAPDP
jgi:hypothetical protein